MISCGYKTPEAITKLNDPKELKKMFKTVRELQELVPDQDKDEMFGIFRRNPSLLKILPGIEMEFKNFVKKVEILLPWATTSNRKRPASKTISTEAKMGKHRPSEAYLAGFKKNFQLNMLMYLWKLQWILSTSKKTLMVVLLSIVWNAIHRVLCRTDQNIYLKFN